jgi:hypothetical protein
MTEMNKNLRTGIMVAMVLAGLLIGATFALAQDNDDPAPDTDAEALLDEIAEDLEGEVSPLLEEIRQKAVAAIDDAVASGALTEEQAEAAKDRVERFGLPEGFPFRFNHHFPRFNLEGFDPACFGFGPEGADKPADCPDIPKEFPFDDHEFRSGRAPDGFDLEETWGRFGGELKGLVDGLNFDFDEFQQLLETGLNPEEALEEMDVDLETVLTDAREMALDRIDEFVADGNLSEETAEMIREKLKSIDFSSGFPLAPHHFGFEMGDSGFEDSEGG